MLKSEAQLTRYVCISTQQNIIQLEKESNSITVFEESKLSFEESSLAGCRRLWGRTESDTTEAT